MKMKRLIALVLCLLLAVCLPVFGAAAEEDAPFYLVLGDSIGYGSGLSNPKEAVYGKIVSDTNGYDYANDAIPGYTTTALLRLMQTEHVKADIEKGDIISISIGGNNYLLGNMMKLMADVLVKGDDSGFAAIGETYYDDLCEIIFLLCDRTTAGSRQTAELLRESAIRAVFGKPRPRRSRVGRRHLRRVGGAGARE